MDCSLNILLHFVHLLSEFLWVSLIKVSFYINLQGDMGFQGRPGPPGPLGVGEPGPPVSEEETVYSMANC